MYHAQFVKFRASDNRRIPVAVSQVVATSADDAMEKLKRLVGAGSWPPYAEAVRLFEDGVEIDSFVLEGVLFMGPALKMGPALCTSNAIVVLGSGLITSS
jgi:hypothetical protein